MPTSLSLTHRLEGHVTCCLSPLSLASLSRSLRQDLLGKAGIMEERETIYARDTAISGTHQSMGNLTEP